MKLLYPVTKVFTENFLVAKQVFILKLLEPNEV